MPPNYNELPVPQSDINQKNLVENEFKKLIFEDDEKNINNSINNDNNNFETSIIEKIKKN